MNRVLSLDSRLTTRRRIRGFTLVELLVVVLILSILMGIAMPLFLQAVANSQYRTCRANMQTIANAVQAAKLETGATNYATLITGGVTIASLPDLIAVPVCPNGGVYSLANGNSASTATFQVACSYIGTYTHSTFQPGVNNN